MNKSFSRILLENFGFFQRAFSREEIGKFLFLAVLEVFSVKVVFEVGFVIRPRGVEKLSKFWGDQQFVYF